MAAAALCWLGAYTLGNAARTTRSQWPPAEEYAVFLPSPSAARVIFAGFRELAADIYWARTLVHNGASMAGESDYRYLERFLDTVLALDPKFERVYKWAGYAVTYRGDSTTQEDFLLSLKYLEQGIQEFPDGYELYFVAGLRYYLDLRSDDPEEQRRFHERGAELIEQAMRKEDAPDGLATYAATLRTKLGQKRRALHDLREMILTVDNEKAQKKLIARYNRLSKTKFPDEARRAKEEFVQDWQRELGFASPSMYVILGDRPSPVIDFEELATERDLFGAAELDAFSEPLEPAELSDEASADSADGAVEPPSPEPADAPDEASPPEPAAPAPPEP